MNLTEPDAGSDLGAVRTSAVPAGDGTWRITGQKIFITFGRTAHTSQSDRTKPPMRDSRRLGI